MADNKDTPELVSYRLQEVEQALTKLTDLLNEGTVIQAEMKKDIGSIRSEFEYYRHTSSRWIVLIAGALMTPVILYLISKIG